jgi:RNA polymerase sigma-70 factor (ECF subfamily)
VDSTPQTLLDRLRRPACPPADWGRFVDLCSPLLFGWAERNGVPDDDAPDLIQTVLLTLLRRLPAYERRPGKTFRGWLWTVLRNAWLDDRRARSRRPVVVAGANPDRQPAPDPVVEFTEAEYRGYLARRLVRVLETDFPERTWRAFRAHVIDGRPAADVAAELGTTPNAVYLARGRVLQRFREELAALAD